MLDWLTLTNYAFDKLPGEQSILLVRLLQHSNIFSGQVERLFGRDLPHFERGDTAK